MPKSSKLALVAKIPLKRLSVKDPRIVMRALMGLLLVGNLVAAIAAFKPFGGSADDLRKTAQQLSTQLRQLQASLGKSKQHVERIGIARSQGDEFLSKYIMEKREASAVTVEEMNKDATEAGIRALPENAQYEALEGSDTLQMMSITAEFEGSYAGLAKLMNLLEKSDRFLIIDYMSLNAPQQQNQKTNAAAAGPQNVNVSVRLLTFVRDETGSVE
jgi:type IV pilus assembly protein PilO